LRHHRESSVLILTIADRMSFANLTNPYKSPTAVPEEYRQHPNLSKLIKQQVKGAAITHIHLEDMRRIRVLLPPRSLQDQIAQVMQEAYGDRQKKLEEAKKLLNSSSRVVLEELDLEISELKDEKYFTVSISKMAGGRFDLDLYNTCYTGLIALLKEKFGSNLNPLKSLSQQITSGATPLGSKYFESGVAFLRVQNLNDKGEIDFGDCLFVSEAFAKTLKRATIQNGDILLVIVGATIGKSAVVKDIEPPLVTNQALARIRIRETIDLLPDFLQVFLSSPAGQIQISALKRPVAQGNLSLTETGQILVPMIPLDQQKKVISRVQAYRSEAKQLRSQAEAVVAVAKARVERMILGEEEIGEN
jgi:restriction endonuclease S subunit